MTCTENKLDKIEQVRAALQGDVGKLKEDVFALDKSLHTLDKGFHLLEEHFVDMNKDLETTVGHGKC